MRCKFNQTMAEAINIRQGVRRFFLGTMRRALTFLTLAILIPVLLIQIAVYHQRVEVRQAQEIQANLEMARAASLSAERYFRDLIRAEAAIGAALTGGPITEKEAEQLLSVDLQEYTSVRVFAWIDPGGRVIWSSEPKLHRLNMSREPYFQAILAGQTWAVSDLIPAPIEGDPIVVVARGVWDAEKRLRGVVYASINPGELEDMALGVQRSKQGSLSIFDRKGMPVFRYPPVDLTWEKRQSWLASDHILAQVRSTGKEATGTFLSPVDGQYRMSARVPIKGTGWVAGASRPIAEVMAPVQQDFHETMVIFLGTACLSLLLAWLLSRRIVRQTQQLRDRAVALGQGMRLPPNGLHGTAEFEAVSHAFDEMVRQLRQSEERFRVVFDQAYQFMGLLKPDGTLIQANQAALGFIHQADQDVLGRPFWETPWWSHSESERAKLRESIHRAAGGQFVRYETTHPTPSGELASVDFSIKPVRDETNNVILLVVEGRDITERKHAERDSRFFKYLAERSHDPFYIISPAKEFRFIYVNEAACRHFGRSLETLLTMRIPDWDPLFSPERCNRIWEELKTKRSIVFDTVHRNADGLEIPVEVSSNYFTYEGQELIAGWFHDITDRKRLENERRQLTEQLEQRVRERTSELEKAVDELTRSNTDLERFAYVSSHDLQEPLRMVASYVGLLEHRYKDKLDPDAREYIGYAVEGAQRMSSLIRDLLEYSRVNARGKPFSPVDMSRILTQALEVLRLRIAETGAEITHDELPSVIGDESQLQQVFQNLLENALKFSRDGEPPRIHVSADHQGDQYLFAVRDNGIGIDPQYHDRIFAIFQRLHARRDKYPGTGVGLAIVKRIVERHGGCVCVESSVGKGSSFIFTIPIRSPRHD